MNARNFYQHIRTCYSDNDSLGYVALCVDCKHAFFIDNLQDHVQQRHANQRVEHCFDEDKKFYCVCVCDEPLPVGDFNALTGNDGSGSGDNPDPIAPGDEHHLAFPDDDDEPVENADDDDAPEPVQHGGEFKSVLNPLRPWKPQHFAFQATSGGRCAVSTDIEKFLLTTGGSDVQVRLTNQDEFAKGVAKYRISKPATAFIVELHNKTPGLLPEHYFSIPKAPANLYIQVPVLFDATGAPLRFAILLRLSSVLREFARTPGLSEALVTEPPPDQTYSHFTTGTYFRSSLTAVLPGTLPFCLAVNTDSADVTKNRRSLWPIYVTLLNVDPKKMSQNCVTKLVGHVPFLEQNELGQERHIESLRLAMFHATLRALFFTGNLYEDAPPVDAVNEHGEEVKVFPWVGMFVSDTQDQKYVFGARYGWRTTHPCIRCDAKRGHASSQTLGELRTFEVTQPVLVGLAEQNARKSATKTFINTRLVDLSLNLVENAFWGLRMFDAARNSPFCALHLRDINLTSLLFELVGKCLSKEPNGRDLVKLLNRKLYHLGAKPIYSDDAETFGQLDKSLNLTGRVKRTWVPLLAAAMSFLVKAPVSANMQLLFRTCVAWRNACAIWCEGCLSEDDVEYLDQLLKEANRLFHEVADLAEVNLERKFIVHGMLHTASDIRAFGAARWFSAEFYEMMHKHVTIPLFRETNKTGIETSLHQQLINAGYRIDFSAPEGKAVQKFLRTDEKSLSPFQVLCVDVEPWQMLHTLVERMQQDHVRRVRPEAAARYRRGKSVNCFSVSFDFLEPLVRMKMVHAEFIHLDPTFASSLSNALEVKFGTGYRFREFGVAHAKPHKMSVLSAEEDGEECFFGLIAAGKLRSTNAKADFLYVIRLLRYEERAFAAVTDSETVVLSENLEFEDISSYAVLFPSEVTGVWFPSKAPLSDKSHSVFYCVKFFDSGL